MFFAEIFLLALALSMDAFAVSVGRGLAVRKNDFGEAFKVASAFGVFQALMFLAGWLCGSGFSLCIQSIDHWIAFVLLAFIGGKMIYDSFSASSAEDIHSGRVKTGELVIMALATSVDALAAGIAVFCGSRNGIAVTAVIIGAVTFILCFAGVLLGGRIGTRFRNKAMLFGGIVLLLIGLKILLEHLGIVNF